MPKFTRKNGLTDAEIAVLHYFVKDRYVAKSGVERWPTGLVDKFRSQLQALSQEIECTALGKDSIGNYLITPTSETEEAFQEKYISLLQVLQVSLPDLMKKNSSVGTPRPENTLGDPIGEENAHENFNYRARFHSIVDHMEQLRTR